MITLQDYPHHLGAPLDRVTGCGMGSGQRGDNNEMPAFLKALAWRDDCEFPEWESRQQKAYFEQPGLGQGGLRPAKCHPAIKLAADLKSPHRGGRVIQYPADGQKKVGGKRMSCCGYWRVPT